MSNTMENIYVGLDIGTTKVCAVVASVGANNEINILGIGKSKSEGLTRGVITHIDKAAASISAAIYDAEQQSGVKIQNVVAGIAGDHIQSFQNRGVVTISGADQSIKQGDVNRLIEDTKKILLPPDRKILHVIPQEFIVDGQDGIYDPVGVSGLRMEATVHIVTGLVSAVQNIIKCIQRAKVNVSDIVLEPFASANAVLEHEEKEVGVALLDIGGGTADLAIFSDHTIRHTAVIGIAGNKVTDDIRRGLGILAAQAEQIKLQYGHAYLPALADNEPITLPGIGGREPMVIEQRMLCQIIQPRMEEILEIVALEIKRSAYQKHLSAGIVLTGGGSLIKGAADLTREILGMPVKMGIPRGFKGGFVREIENPMYATGVGLVLNAIKKQQRGITGNIGETEKKLSGGVKSVFTKMKDWFKEF
ncbi:MAG: cell division protein FtsA [Bacteroidetes bacterium]|nr:cell division protein FtsA [Bacteroidota bacterium]